MLKFSEEFQSFYDTDIEYQHLPKDLVEITPEQHTDLLNKINSGYRVFSDLTTSSLKPTPFHKWLDGGWVDLRTEEEKLEQYRSQFKPLTRYQFFRALFENGFKSEDIENLIQGIEDEYQRGLVLLGWQTATNFIRTDESVLFMQNVLNLSTEQVDQMWEYAMRL